jgi:hypothetical protein
VVVTNALAYSDQILTTVGKTRAFYFRQMGLCYETFLGVSGCDLDRITIFNGTAHIRHQCRKTTVLSRHRCLINTDVEKLNYK